ncbi:MAG: glycosyltransferase family 2 protein, partial [Bacteroidota bacterium]
MRDDLDMATEPKHGYFEVSSSHRQNGDATQKTPKLSVVMPVYNGEQYLREAMDSVLQQPFEDLELLVINDGSIDGSVEVLKSYADPRIRYIDNIENRGVAYSRNVGLREARGEYLAWCDCDDLSLPNRFVKQIAFLDEHLEYGACGTWLERFGDDKNYVSKAASDPDYLEGMLLFTPALPNATVMLRMKWIREQNMRYHEDLPVAEDHDFIMRCSWRFPMTNLQEVHYKYRASETSIMKQFS